MDKSKREGKNPHAVALGRLGGEVGGPARAEAMTQKERSNSARKAARERWKRKQDFDTSKRKRTAD